jgi:hypothetical protein
VGIDLNISRFWSPPALAHPALFMQSLPVTLPAGSPPTGANRPAAEPVAGKQVSSTLFRAPTAFRELLYIAGFSLITTSHMPRLLLLFLALLLASHSARAQVAPPPSPTSAPASAFARTGQRDTIYAIRHLFERRRLGGKKWLFVSLSGVIGVTRVLLNPNTTTVNGYQTKSELDGEAAAVFGVGFLGLPVAVGLSKLTRFSEKRETEVISTYATTHRLPSTISRRLRRKDFLGGI